MDDDDTADFLNKLGEIGFEMCGINARGTAADFMTKYFFKRPVQE
jgi:hypothetical protein